MDSLFHQLLKEVPAPVACGCGKSWRSVTEHGCEVAYEVMQEDEQLEYFLQGEAGREVHQDVAEVVGVLGPRVRRRYDGRHLPQRILADLTLVGVAQLLQSAGDHLGGLGDLLTRGNGHLSD